MHTLSFPSALMYVCCLSLAESIKESEEEGKFISV